jgi:hypothetical protein
VSQNLPNPPAEEPAVPAYEPAIPGPVRPKGGISNRALNLLLGGALVLAVAGVAFAAGRMTAPAPSLTGGNFPGNFPGGNFPGGGQGGNGQGRGNGNGNGGVFFGGGAGPTIEGTVESITDTTLTLKTADGQTIQIALDGDTSYHRQSDASDSDVVTGSKVLVRLDFRRGDGQGGPQATAGTGGTTTGPTANDVTVVP